ncbi:carotenoid biosynthesis protein [Ilumatobacter nonamiensis]|uniref:carotenoid biosynthesis protein n=1 Tax=Ilumatobacter nonamiensis TaxID=467093 RepID=UPI00034DA92A|nr:carotenoid biosynthesis protein [Ilumatobacter nonamiensis]
MTDRIAAVAGAVTVAGMIATPLLPQRGRGRRILSSVVVSGMWATTTANAVRRWGGRRAGIAGASTVVATGAVERIGTHTGVPFGRYAYTNALRPQIAHVPVIVPLAWFGMGLPAREAAHAALGERSTAATRIALGSAAMTAWDLFLDPQMVGEGFWAWARRGVYRGIPLSNFAGWFVTGLAIMALFELALPVQDPDGRRRDVDGSADVRLVGQYGYMSVMQTLGFARFFRDPVVATVGGIGMLPLATAAAVQLRRRTA